MEIRSIRRKSVSFEIFILLPTLHLQIFLPIVKCLPSSLRLHCLSVPIYQVLLCFLWFQCLLLHWRLPFIFKIGSIMWEKLLFVSHYHNPLLPFTATLWSCLHFLTFYHSSVLLSSVSAFITPQKLFQQKSPKFPNCQMQRAFDGVLMWALRSVSTVVAPLFPTPLYSRLFPSSPPTAFLFLYKLFFHQLLEYPSGPGGSKLIPFSSAHIILFHLCEKDCLSPSLFWAPTCLFSQHFHLASHTYLKFIFAQSHTPASPPHLC